MLSPHARVVVYSSCPPRRHSRYSWTLGHLPRSSRLALGSLGTAERRPRGRRGRGPSPRWTSWTTSTRRTSPRLPPVGAHALGGRRASRERPSPLANGGRSSRHRAHRAIGGRAQPTNLTLTGASPRSVPRPAPFHTYLSLSAPVAPLGTPLTGRADHDLAAISRAIRGSPAQDTVAPDRARQARATARGNDGPQRAKAKTSATRPDNLKTTSLPSRNLPVTAHEASRPRTDDTINRPIVLYHHLLDRRVRQPRETSAVRPPPRPSLRLRLRL